MEERIGIRELRSRLSAVLRRVKRGESIVITERNEPIAVLLPNRRRTLAEDLERLAAGGHVHWAGGKPAGLERAPRLKGSPAADAVIADRR